MTTPAGAAAPDPDQPVRRAAPHAAEGASVVSVRDLGKCYEIYVRPIDRLKQTLWRGRRQFYREFWALRDVSFEVRRGETLGIIGRNGSGKSTLLQMIAGTLRPTQGQVEVRGRVHALLELGSGFNPEFTGRENVFLNGAVLGVPPAVVKARFEEIAGFADIGEFIDQPIKTYSTGMVVRLAFAAQVLLEPDVLIIDEALAVGDAAFQLKCFNRMRQLSERGVSIILVTHDTQTVRSFCHRAIWLERGQLMQQGSTAEVTSAYVQSLFKEQADPRAQPSLADSDENDTRPAPSEASLFEPRRVLVSLSGRSDLVRWGSGKLRVRGVSIDDGRPGAEPLFQHGGRLHIEFEVEALENVDSREIGFGFAFLNVKALNVINGTTHDEGQRFTPLEAGQHIRVAFEVDNILAAGSYALVCVVEDRSGPTYHYYDFVENAALFSVESSKPIHSLVLPTVRHAAQIGGAGSATPEAPA